MANPHRTNVLVTSCLKTPVDPHTKAPLASYERGRVLPYTDTGHLDNRDYEKELEYEDFGSDFCHEDYLEKGVPHMGSGDKAAGDCLDLSKIFFSNEEYYSKLEELKKAHLHTMAELESMYQQKLQLKSMEPLDMATLELGNRMPWPNISPAASHHHLRKSHSAVELRRGSGQSDSSDENEAGSNNVEKGLLFSPKEYISNMWKDFKVSPNNRHMSSSSLHSIPGDQRRLRKRREKREHGEQEHWKPKVTVPKPFHMMLREAEKQKHCIKTRSEVELENAELRRQLEELTECQKQFRASPVPAHVHLPVYEELRERNEERRRTMREREVHHLRTVQKPFSFLERERLKKEQKQLHQQQESDQDKVKPFKAKPVPKSVYAAASGEQMKEEQLYRSIKIQLRAQEMLRSASVPPSMLTRSLSDRKKTKDGSAAAGRDDSFSHKPQINKEVPDFNASYRHFQKQLEKRKDVKPTTACEPFELKTSQISSHRERILADIEKDRSSPRMLRWPYINSGSARTPNSSLCSSLSGSLELLPAKFTGTTKKRHEAVRKALEQRKRAEEEEERYREKQREREKKLQRMVLKRAQANDPHLALSQTHKSKLKEFRKQDLQRKKEYKQEIREMRERVKGRPLLLEQVTQRNAKQAAEKHYIETLRGYDVTEDFISSKADNSASERKTSTPSDIQSDQENAEYKTVHCKKVFLDDEDIHFDVENEEERDGQDSYKASLNHLENENASGHLTEHDCHGDDPHYSDESYHYSDDHENFSEDSEHDVDVKQQESVD
ncbi:protein FAM161A isoform X1 [Girardinichthys multiradiatus]|uniref:protein FAM161A isoform X1 n=1 Tax=Girardinichthys multiradiatus TaxID=208333 RepID=UPI001FAB79CC|nr:protein FAM161A isoform X1 [Girardinichthys multiradiatus]